MTESAKPPAKAPAKESARALNIVSPAYVATAWLFLAAVVALMVGAFMVRVPVVVNGQGVLMADTEVVNYAIMPETDGRLEAFAVKIGSPVRKGQVIARVSIPRLDNEIETARTGVKDLKHKSDRLAAFHTESLAVSQSSLQQLRQEARNREAALRERLARLDKTRQGNAELIAKGYLSPRAIDPVVTEREQVEDQIAVSRRQLLDAEANYTELVQRQKREKLDLSLQLSSYERQLQALLDRTGVETLVVSPYDGVISDLLVDLHQPVSRERRIATVTPAGSVSTGRNLITTAVVFVPAQEGKKITLGMPAQILPLIYEEQEFGRIQSVVTEISTVAADEDVLQRVFKNQKLVRKLFEAEAPYKVTVKITHDERNASGLAWTSSRGPARLMEPGTIVSGWVVYNQPRILYLLLPAVKRLSESAWINTLEFFSGPGPAPAPGVRP
jgi:HlyD family secretion protein